MSNNYEITQRSLNLAATMQDGIEHIRERFAEGRFEEMLPLLQDVTQAFISIQQALLGRAEGMNSRCFTGYSERIYSGLSELVLAYELADWNQAVRSLENEVVPGFTLWKEELERCYRHHVVS